MLLRGGLRTGSTPRTTRIRLASGAAIRWPSPSMPLRAHILYAIAASADVAVAVFVARKMSKGEGILGPVVVLVTFLSWALCVWLTPLGPHLWRASALGFIVVGAFLVLSLAALRSVPLFVGQPEGPIARRARGDFLVRCASLVLLLLMLPVIAHLASGGLLPAQQ